MYGYGYGGGYNSYGGGSRRDREVDYMDLKHPHFKLRAHDLGDSDEDHDHHSKLRKLRRKQEKDGNGDEFQEMKDAPLLQSAAQNLLQRGEGNSALSAVKAVTSPTSPLPGNDNGNNDDNDNGDDMTDDTTNTPQQQQQQSAAPLTEDHFEELMQQLDETYDYQVCVDCKVSAKFVCIQCHDAFCSVCFVSNHRRGKRALHDRVTVELYQKQRYDNGVDHYQVPHELPPLEEIDERIAKNIPRENVANNTTTTTTTTTAAQSSGGGGLLSSIFSVFGGSNPYDKYAREPITKPSANNMNNNDNEDNDDDNNNNNSTMPYKTLSDDPAALDGWWRGTPKHWIRGRAKFIPLRLNHDERYHLRLLIAVISNSNYIHNVDYACYDPATQKTNIKKRTLAMVTNCIAVLTSLIAAKNLSAAMEPNCIIKYKVYLEHVLELGVRHYLRQQKQCGWFLPLMSLLQDLQNPQIVQVLGTRISITIRTVHTILAPRNMLYVLDSNLVYQCTEPICVDTKSDVAKRISTRKNAALKELTSRFAKQTGNWDSVIMDQISEQQLLLCVYSVGDHNLNLHYSRDICTRVGRLLCGMYNLNHKLFIGINRCIDNALIAAGDNDGYYSICKNITVDVEKLTKPEDINEERHQDFLNAGAKVGKTSDYDVAKVYNNDLDFMVHQCLNTENQVYASHDQYHAVLKDSPMFRTHHTHLRHVLQTISFWETLTHYLPFLMFLSVELFLNVTDPPEGISAESRPPPVMYTLANNGQGIHRLQSATLLSRVITALVVCILRGVGSGAVHIGDAAVVNSLAFTDKYLQLNPILSPILATARYWWNTTHPNTKQRDKTGFKHNVLCTFTSQCLDTGHRKMLQHLSLHGMDGSGGPNSYLAGSCLDGSTTSLNNWCNKVFSNFKLGPLFLLAGFTSFNTIEWD